MLVSISDIAKRKGVSKQAISKRVQRLEDLGQIATYDGPRGARMIVLAEYDRAVGEVGDPAHAQAPTRQQGRNDDDPSGHVYTREQAREKAYSADLKQLDLHERLGKLVPVENISDAACRLGETIVRQLEQLASHADEMAAAVAKDGTQGARTALKALAREIRESIARELEHLADTAQTEHDAPPAEPVPDA